MGLPIPHFVTRNNDGTLTVPIDKICVGERKREEYGDLKGLEWSLQNFSLIQPVIIERRDDGNVWLIAGGRRLAAAKNLGWDTIKAVFREDLDSVLRLELEYEENIRRKDLTWQEEVKSMEELHRLKKERWDSIKTFPGSWGQKKTADELGISEAKLSLDIMLSEGLRTFPKLVNCRTKNDALSMLRKYQQGANLDEESHLLTGIVESLIVSPFDEGVKKIQPISVDLILTDLYKLDYSKTIPALLSLLKPTGHAFVFFELDYLTDALVALSSLGIPHKKRPYIWHIKGEDGYAPYLWFSRNMSSPPKYIKDHLSFKRDSNSVHTVEKPRALLNAIVSNASMKGAFVLDPNCFGPSIVQVCLELQRNLTAFCPSRSIYDQGILNLNKKQEIDGDGNE